TCVEAAVWVEFGQADGAQRADVERIGLRDTSQHDVPIVAGIGQCHAERQVAERAEAYGGNAAIAERGIQRAVRVEADGQETLDLGAGGNREPRRDDLAVVALRQGKEMAAGEA